MLLKSTAIFLILSSANPVAAMDWPQWRGPARDGIAPAKSALVKWSKAPVKVWSISLGGGHSSPVVSGERVIQHFREGENEVIAAFNLKTGKELWRDFYAVSYSARPEAQELGLGPFATPTISEGRVFTFGINEMISAYDVATGKRLWRTDWGSEFPLPHPVYGTSASPLVTDGKVIVYVGGPGKGALVALDVKTGAVLWRLDGEGPPYGAAVVGTLGSVRQVVTQSQSSLLGVDLKTGTKLWQRPFPVQYDGTILTPIIDGDRVLLAGYDVDLHAFTVTKNGANWTTGVAWTARQPMDISSPVLVEGRLFGFGHLKKGQFFALDPITGKVLWTSPGGLGAHAALASSGRNLLALTEDGVLRVLERGDTFRELAKHQVADAATWAHPALLPGGRMLIKDALKLTLWSFAAP